MNSNQKLNFVWYTDISKDNITYMCQSISTLLKFNKIDKIYVIYLSNSDNKQNIDEEIKILYEEMRSIKYTDNCGEFVIKCITHCVDAIDENFPELPNTMNGRLRYYSLIRFFIGLVPEIEDEIIWYCDTDVLFNGKVDDMLRSVQEANTEMLLYFFNRKEYQAEPRGYENTSYLNAGIHMMNVRLWKELDCLKILIEFYNKYYDFVTYVNQTGFQFISTLWPLLVKVDISDEYNIKPSFGVPNDKIKIMHFNGECNKKVMKGYYDSIMRS